MQASDGDDMKIWYQRDFFVKLNAQFDGLLRISKKKKNIIFIKKINKYVQKLFHFSLLSKKVHYFF